MPDSQQSNRNRRSVPLVDPIPNESAAITQISGETALVIADYHAGIERGLRYERGVELDSNASHRRTRLRQLLKDTDPDRLIFLGDVGHSIGNPGSIETTEVRTLLKMVLRQVPVTLVRGNHDSELLVDIDTDSLDAEHSLRTTSPHGTTLGNVGFIHGHTWPDRSLLEADRICMGHEHPNVRLSDAVGGERKEKAWVRGELRLSGLTAHFAELDYTHPDQLPELIIFPAFNTRSGGTAVNNNPDTFLAPYLPSCLDTTGTEAYRLDGTRLGPYDQV